MRLELSASASGAMKERLMEGLGARPDQVYEIEGLLDLAEVMQLAALSTRHGSTKPGCPS